jgi:sec-independent protein translocase protein TatA
MKSMGIGPEWLVVIGIVVLLFGAKKLPELARSMGKASSEFKKGIKEGSSSEEPVQAAEPSEPTKPAETPGPEA